MTCKVKKAKSAKKVKVTCKVITSQPPRPGSPRGRRTIARRDLKAGIRRVVFRLARRGHGRYSLRLS